MENTHTRSCLLQAFIFNFISKKIYLMQYKILVPGINTRYYVPWKYYILCIFFFLYVNNTLFFTLTRLGSRLMTC